MDHDQRLKVLLKEFLPEFFAAFFPEWAGRFDFSAVEWLDTEVFSNPPQGERRTLDLVARLPARDGSEVWTALIHIEVESRDSVAAFRPRMFEYFSLVRRHGLPVLPIAIFLRVGLGGVGTDEYTQDFGGFEVLRFRYLYVGLPALEAERFVGDNPIALALTGLMRPGKGRELLKLDALDRALKLPLNDRRRFLVCESIDAYLPMEEPQLAEYERLLRTPQYREVRNMETTTFGRGRKEGFVEGKAEGERSMLAEQLDAKFGPLSDVVRERLKSKSESELKTLGRALLTAASLRDLGLED